MKKLRLSLIFNEREAEEEEEDTMAGARTRRLRNITSKDSSRMDRGFILCTFTTILRRPRTRGIVPFFRYIFKNIKPEMNNKPDDL